MRTSRVRFSLAALAALASWGCQETYTLDLPDVNIQQPDDLPERLKRFRSGEEKWHNDPRAVSDLAIRRHCDVPWKAESYKASSYEVKESPEWGTYTVRGYIYPSGHLMRYRVKVRKYQEIWYAVQISRYKLHDVGDEAHHDHGH